MVTRSEWWSVYLFETLGGVGVDQQGGQSADYLTGSAGLDNGTLVRTIDIGQCVGQVVQRELSDLERRGHARQLAQVALHQVGHAEGSTPQPNFVANTTRRPQAWHSGVRSKKDGQGQEVQEAWGAL